MVCERDVGDMQARGHVTGMEGGCKTPVFSLKCVWLGVGWMSEALWRGCLCKRIKFLAFLVLEIKGWETSLLDHEGGKHSIRGSGKKARDLPFNF